MFEYFVSALVPGDP